MTLHARLSAFDPCMAAKQSGKPWNKAIVCYCRYPHVHEGVCVHIPFACGHLHICSHAWIHVCVKHYAFTSTSYLAGSVQDFWLGGGACPLECL